MKKQIYFTSLFLLLWIGCFAQADIVTVSLTELAGPVGRHPNWNVIDVDLGVTFSEIQSVKIQVSGTITPGLGQGDGVARPVLPYFELPGVIEIFIGSCITTVGPFNGSFSVEQFLECTYDANWDILLDGQAELIAHITSNLTGIGFGLPLEYPTADISQATLIVEGVVIPEPSTLLFFCLAGLMLRRNHRSKNFPARQD